VRPRIRLLLLLQAAALAAVAGVVLVGVGIPLAASGGLAPRALVALALMQAVVLAVVGTIILVRWSGRPVERLLSAAERLGAREGLPLLGPPEEASGPGLTRAAVAFERLAAALGEDRARLAAKLEELERSNRELGEARESLLRAERLATVGRLGAGIAHEIGNPLGAITGYAELARERLASGAASGEAADCVARIGAEAARIDAIVRDLLDFARPAPLALGPVDVRAAAEASLRLATMQPRVRGVEVDLAVEDGLPPAHADERRLGQVLLNLLLNAADAMGGQGTVRLRAAAIDGGDRIELAIADEGPGIPEAILPRIFDPFFTTKEPGQGTGLGLAVCHGILQSFGGEIVAENAPGGGAVVRLRIPAAPPSSRSATP
jgi:two-component system, NtrC family, sensor kinase